MPVSGYWMLLPPGMVLGRGQVAAFARRYWYVEERERRPGLPPE